MSLKFNPFPWTFGIVFIWLFLNTVSEKKDEEEKYDYRYVHFNSKTNRSTVGFVKRSSPLREDFISYHDECEENHYLISNFESDSYVCSGSCICEEQNTLIERRSSSSVSIFRSFLYLLAASTTLMAYHKAREYFHDECIDLLNNNNEEKKCFSENIRSEVAVCFRNLEYRPYWAEDDPPDERYAPDPEVKVKHLCKGSCLPNYKLNNDEDAELYVIVKDYKCQKIEFKGIVVIDYTGHIITYGDDPLIITDASPGLFEGVNTDARNHFMDNVLEPMCQENSWYDEKTGEIQSSGAKFTEDFEGLSKEVKESEDFDEEVFKKIQESSRMNGKVKLCLGKFDSGNPSVSCSVINPPIEEEED